MKNIENFLCNISICFTIFKTNNKFIFIAPANAYIDPGTGSFIIQAILAVGASIVIYLKNPITMIKSFFKSNKKKDKLDNKEENK